MADISAITSNPNAVIAEETLSRIPAKTLDQDDFLKLLVTQFTNQDPLSPMKDTEYIAQMASFTSLEQTKTMSEEITNLRNDNQMLQATALLGSAVELRGEDSEDPRTIGTVSAVVMEAGKPMIVVNDAAYELGRVLSIKPTLTQ